MENPDEPVTESFAYRARKDGSVSITWSGREATILRGEAAGRFLEKVRAATPRDAQLEMARVTGNFKRGNERLARTRESRKEGQ
jgi:hypothetical protein